MATIKVLQKQNNQLKNQLAAKAKEIKIETSLERVRAIALRMKEPADMLKICKTISLQLEKLGLHEIRNVQTAIFYPGKGTYMNYEFYARHDKTFITETLYTNHGIAKAFAKKMMEGKGNFYITNIKGAKVQEWLTYQKTTNVFIDRFLKTASSLNYYWYSLGPVALGISTYAPLSKENQDLFKRFLRVFELAYRRYLDIEKAEMQAREAQIETAMERIRSAAMAMHSSSDILHVTHVLREQISLLGEKDLESILVHIYHEDADVYEAWYSYRYPGSLNKEIVDGQHLLDWGKTARARKDKEKYYQQQSDYTIVADCAMLREWYQYLFTVIPEVVEVDTKGKILVPDVLYYNYSKIAGGALLLITNTEASLSSKDLLKRAAKVFNLAYKRFLDLQKAEAQARESQIEAALERIRSASMGMHKSDDLINVVELLDEEIAGLGIKVENTSIITDFSIPQKGLNNWMARKGTRFMDKFHIPYLEHPITQKLYGILEEGIEYYSDKISKEEKNKYFRLLFKQSDFKMVPKERQDYVYSAPGWTRANIVSKNSILIFQRYQLSDFSKEEEDIFRRFGKVFEQTYTRFLDLQNAEKQAREAEIELALERVRARTMSMQKSEELQEVVHTVLERLKDLNVEFYTAIIILFAKDSKDITWWLENKEKQQYSRVLVPYTNIAYLRDLFDSRKNGRDHFSKIYSFDEKNELFHHLFSATDFKYVPEKQRKFLLESEAASMSVALAKNTGLHLTRYANKAFSEADNEILKRFAKVFEQAYTRFLDLQKAEAQARESQIQLALERVRARTMAMQKSDELAEAAALLFQQVRSLGIETYSSGFTVWQNNNNELVSWMCNADGSINPPFNMPAKEIAWHRQQYESWKNKEDYIIHDFTGEEMRRHYAYLRSFPSLDEAFKKSEAAGVPTPVRQVHNAFNFSHGNLLFITSQPVPKAYDIFKRFAKVFEQTYTRFLDLQKAEAQARESQIQLALERVRARTMAMQKSDELSEVVFVLFQQFKELGENPDQATIGVINEKEHVIEYWVTMYGNQMNKVFKFSMDEPHVTNKIYHAWKKGMKSLVIDLSGKELLEFMSYRAGKGGAAVNYNEKRRIINVAFFSKGLLNVQSNEERSEESIKLLERFASVFEQTYTRFLDLQRAEAQAREAQVEVALERVRARAMAMHASQELKEIALELRKQMGLLGQEELETCAIHLYDESPDYFQSWAALRPPNTEGDIIQRESLFPKRGVKIIEEMMECYQSNKQDYVLINDGAKAQEFFEMVKQHSAKVFDVLSESFKGLPQEDIKAYWSVADFKGGSLVMTTMVEPEETTRVLLRRFANVFGLAYRRFMDLKHAEAQAREATIEAALEKVRGKAMAMHNSNDLAVTASMVFTELRKLGIRPIRCGVGLLSNESRKAGLYSATSSTNEDSLSLIGWVQLEKHPVLEKIYESWLRKGDYFPELEGEQLISYYKLLLAGLPVPVPDFSNEQKQFGHFISFSIGCLYAWSETPYKPEQINILKRFAGIIDLTFRRYLELQQSEANAKEAVRQAVLDRIRADIASMRTTADLNRIIPLVWNELTILGLPFIRCGVFIMDNEHQLIHTFLSTPEGRAIAAFKIPYDTPGKIKMIPINWKNNTAYVDHWNDSDFTDFANTLLQQEVIDSAGEYLAGVPHGGFYLHFLPFLQGMMYVGNTTELNDEELSLVQSVADAFSTAYARYEDFNKLEEAKKQVDKTLVELKQTQQQLVQSEKMASLGELTAGIAHEIQNPLNFVNNFSEVSKELLEEMKTALESGDKEEAEALANDIIQNLEKINHHGKRADSIVKGMLEHSRKSEGVKTPTDINALCDEYLRLSYHGMRAKDKSFNVDFRTDFDNNIEKINLIPQEIGRVLLNLYNNAFYAVNEQKSKNPGSYQPAVSVSTKRSENSVTITVKDNGGGIPENIREKIFQPFFTTKPTGSGTGLGLSLSYDIVKAHGGEIKVESKEACPEGRVGGGEGTEFTIRLPIK